MSIQTNGDDERTQISKMCKILGVDAHLYNGMGDGLYAREVDKILVFLLRPSAISLAQVQAIGRLYPDHVEDAKREAFLKGMADLNRKMLGDGDETDTEERRVN